MNEKPDFRTLLTALKEQRDAFTGIDSEYKTALQAAEVTLKPQLDKRKLASEAVRQLEDQIKRMAVEHVKATGDKKPAPGVEIRLMHTLAYSEADALNWAKQHNLALKLDADTFEGLAKAAPKDFAGIVTFKDEPKATIATDLAKVMSSDDWKPAVPVEGEPF